VFLVLPRAVTPLPRGATIPRALRSCPPACLDRSPSWRPFRNASLMDGLGVFSPRMDTDRHGFGPYVCLSVLLSTRVFAACANFLYAGKKCEDVLGNSERLFNRRDAKNAEIRFVCLLCALRVSAVSLPLRKPPRLPEAVPTPLHHALTLDTLTLHASVAASPRCVPPWLEFPPSLRRCEKTENRQNSPS